jgi:hypothetical protein
MGPGRGRGGRSVGRTAKAERDGKVAHQFASQGHGPDVGSVPGRGELVGAQDQHAEFARGSRLRHGLSDLVTARLYHRAGGVWCKRIERAWRTGCYRVFLHAGIQLTALMPVAELEG